MENRLSGSNLKMLLSQGPTSKKSLSPHTLALSTRYCCPLNWPYLSLSTYHGHPSGLLPRRPLHRAPTDNVQMKVKDGLTAVTADIGDNTVPILGEPLASRDFRGGKQQGAQEL